MWSTEGLLALLLLTTPSSFAHSRILPMSLFSLGDFTLHSGARSRWKIDCDALTDEDITTLAVMISQLVGSFSSVEGIPRGGLHLATALKSYAVRGGRPHLIVDDVLTTGRSMEEVHAARVKNWPWGDPGNPAPSIVGAVLFARGPCPPWIRALFTLPPELAIACNPL